MSPFKGRVSQERKNFLNITKLCQRPQWHAIFYLKITTIKLNMSFKSSCRSLSLLSYESYSKMKRLVTPTPGTAVLILAQTDWIKTGGYWRKGLEGTKKSHISQSQSKKKYMSCSFCTSAFEFLHVKHSHAKKCDLSCWERWYNKYV